MQTKRRNNVREKRSLGARNFPRYSLSAAPENGFSSLYSNESITSTEITATESDIDNRVAASGCIADDTLTPMTYNFDHHITPDQTNRHIHDSVVRNVVY